MVPFFLLNHDYGEKCVGKYNFIGEMSISMFELLVLSIEKSKGAPPMTPLLEEGDNGG